VLLNIHKAGTAGEEAQEATITLTEAVSTQEYTFSGLKDSTRYYVWGRIYNDNNELAITSSLYFKTLGLTASDKDNERKWWYDGLSTWVGPYTKPECVSLAKDFDRAPKPVCTYFDGDPNVTNPIGNIERLSVTARSPINLGETSQITASMSPKKSGVVINFLKPTAEGASLSDTKCITDSNGFCPPIIFTASKKVGIYAVGFWSDYGTGAVTITVQTTTPTPKTETNYYLLAPIPGLGEEICTTDANGVKTCTNKVDTTKGFGNYLNTMIQIFMGICAVLAMIMLILGGVEYMTSELVSGKQAGKQRMLHAILGLLLALGSYAILNTLNPALLNIGLGNLPVATITVIDLPDVGDETIDPNCKDGKATYSTSASVSPGTTSAVAKLKQGWAIDSFKVSTNNKMTISLKNGSTIDNSNIIDIRPGLNGYADTNTGATGDKKTPQGSWKILSINTPGGNKANCSKTGSNMGASFWLLNPMTTGERGIGMHGNENGTLTKTYGCVRLKNADILALLPYVKAGIPVYIGSSSGTGTTTRAESFDSVQLIKNTAQGATVHKLSFEITGFTDKKAFRYEIWTSGGSTKITGGDIRAPYMMADLDIAIYDAKIKNNDVLVKVFSAGINIGRKVVQL
jgi:lipoprotein-anchoring transpeptidase ErfK/SrfK